MTKWVLIIAMLMFSLQAYALEDCIVTAKEGKLLNIRIENNRIIDVYPLITIKNEKNTLVVHPLAIGTTCFTVSKNMKEDFIFYVNVTETATEIKGPEGFKILKIDVPPQFERFELDMPPNLLNKEKING